MILYNFDINANLLVNKDSEKYIIQGRKGFYFNGQIVA